MEIENTSIRLKKIMKERNLRQVDLLEMVKPFCNKYNVKINKSDLSQYISGKVKPGQEKLSMLGMALGITESWLMGYDVEKESKINANAFNLSKEEITLLENFNKLNTLGKTEANKRIAELTEINRYINDTANEISATNIISKDKNNILDSSEIFIPYKSLDEVGTTIAAHDDELTNEEKILADKILLDYINNERLKEFNEKNNK